MINKLYKKYNIYIWAVLASIVLTLIKLAYNQPFNVDGILYLKSAAAFTDQGLKQAMEIYPWPFYSISIALTAKITYLSYLHSAYLLSAILDTMIVILFIALIKELSGTRKIQIIGALVILFLPLLNHYRDQVLRGHGYYAFALLSILLLIHYSRSYKWRYATGWALAAMVATLFRIEGAILVCFLPLILLFKPKLKFGFRIRHFIQAYTVQIIIFVLMLFFSIFISKHLVQHGSPYLGRALELKYQLINGLQTTWHVLQAKIAAIKAIGIWTLNPYQGWVAYFLGGGLFFAYSGLLISTLGLLYVVLGIYAILQKLIPADWSAKAIWFYAILLNIILTAIYLCQHLFLSYRYVALLCFLLLVGVPFALEKIYFNWKMHKPTVTGSRWFFPLLCIGLLYAAIGSVGHFGPSKTYIIKAGQWINNHTPAKIKIYSNDVQFCYYTKRFCNSKQKS